MKKTKTLTPKNKVQDKKKIQRKHLCSTARKSLEEAWLAKNREAIQAQNEHFEKHGPFGEEYRSF